MNLNPEKTAVVLIEFQNDFTSIGGSLHEAVKEVMQATQMLDNTVSLVTKFREIGALVIHVPISFTDNYNELSRSPYGILKGVVDSKSFRKGTWGVEIVDVLKPMANEIIVEGKRGLDGFVTTNLDFILRSRGVETIALAGFLTNCCVESTMRTGYELGYQVITLTDCTATLSMEEQKMACEKDFPMFSRPMKSTEFLDELEGKLSAVAGSGRGYA